MRKHRRDLERAHEAEPRDVRRPHRGDVAAVERDSPRGRRDEFGQHVEAGRFASAVRADQGVDRSALDAQRHVADGAEIAEALAEALGDENLVGAHCRRSPERMRFPVEVAANQPVGAAVVKPQKAAAGGPDDGLRKQCG